MGTMEQEHRNVLRSKRILLSQHMDNDAIVSHLFSVNVISTSDVDTLTSISSNDRRNEKLLDILPRRGPRAFNQFVEALRKNKLAHLIEEEYVGKAVGHHVKITDEEKSPKIPKRVLQPVNGNESNGAENVSMDVADEQPPPDGGLDIAHDPGVKQPIFDEPTYFDSVDTGKAISAENEDGPVGSNNIQMQTPNVPNDANMVTISTMLDSSFSYPMSTTPRGYFLLVNNKDFLPASTMELYPRNGTDVDAAAISQLFQDLGFVVDVQRNLKCGEILEAVSRLVNLDHSNASAVGCCFLSHGKEGVLYGVDGELKIKDITAAFQKSKSLVGKPKMFFFQACQGSEYMDSVEPLCQVDGPGDLYGNDISLPTEADYLYAYSTVPGYYSWRNSRNGSWFVQAIVEVFRAYAHKMDVVRMLTRVNHIVSTKKSTTGQRLSHNKRQVCSIVTQLRYELFLNPPHGPLRT